jgi:hypothetical protein
MRPGILSMSSEIGSGSWVSDRAIQSVALVWTLAATIESATGAPTLIATVMIGTVRRAEIGTGATMRTIGTGK